ncbi:MAG: DUF2971 domain-containing protein [Armatimonadetes bacterium]|nr:DUF2971 domain-containing protein [Armatimonadota bacterium]
MSPEELAVAKVVQAFTTQLPGLLAQARPVATALAAAEERYVFQYTSVPTLLAMLAPHRPYVVNSADGLRDSMGSVWATAAQYMNDTQEFMHGRDVFRAAVLRAQAKEPAPAAAALLAQAAAAASECDGADVFCACFSAESDHLGQWRGYGDGGRGCALGFEREALAQAINGLAVWVAYNSHVDIENVDLEGADTVADQLVGDLISALCLKRVHAEDPDAFDAAARAELARLLPTVFLCFKDLAFQDEKEFRVICSESVAFRRLTDHGTDATEGSFRWYRATGAGIIPFVMLDLGNNARGLLKTVRLGPAAESDLNQSALRSLLCDCGYAHVDVTTSSIPFIPR